MGIGKKSKIREQREAYAIKACHMMGKTVEEAAAALVMDERVIEIVYGFIEMNAIDFEGPFSED